MTLLIGASQNPSRYSYLALQKLLLNNIPVVAIGSSPFNVFGLEVLSGFPSIPTIDTITLYINPTIQKSYYDYILGLKPKRIIFNPGTENPELFEIATKNGIIAFEACTLVLLATGRYQTAGN